MTTLSIKEAKELQKCMAEKVILDDDFAMPRFIGGMDVSNNLYDPAQMIYAAVVVLDLKELKIVDQATLAEKQSFPYMTGLLGFREAPALVKAFQKLTVRPDIVMVDGHGISHPRGLGIASHIGVLLDIPTIGVAKSILVGELKKEVAASVRTQVPLIWNEKTIAMAYRSKARARPLFISSGHRVSLATAVKLLESCLTKYRLPEPTRHAHLAANECRKEHRKKID